MLPMALPMLLCSALSIAASGYHAMIRSSDETVLALAAVGGVLAAAWILTAKTMMRAPRRSCWRRRDRRWRVAAACCSETVRVATVATAALASTAALLLLGVPCTVWAVWALLMAVCASPAPAAALGLACLGLAGLCRLAWSALEQRAAAEAEAGGAAPVKVHVVLPGGKEVVALKAPPTQRIGAWTARRGLAAGVQRRREGRAGRLLTGSALPA